MEPLLLNSLSNVNGARYYFLAMDMWRTTSVSSGHLHRNRKDRPRSSQNQNLLSTMKAKFVSGVEDLRAG